MKMWDQVRFSAAMPTPRQKRPTLSAGIFIFDVIVTVTDMPDTPKALEWFESWLDDVVPGHGPLTMQDNSDEHDCPSCRCWQEEPSWTFTASLPGRSSSEVALAVERLSVPFDQRVAA